MILTKTEFETVRAAQVELGKTELTSLVIRLGALLDNCLIVTVRDLGYRKVNGPKKK